MEGWNRWFKRWLPGGGGERGDSGGGGSGGGSGSDDRARRNRLLLMLIGLGVLLLLLSRLDGPGPKEAPDGGSTPVGTAQTGPFSSEEALQRRLEELLGRIAGAGAVEVFVTFETSERYHYALQTSEKENRNYEADGAGNLHLIEYDADRSAQPVLVRDEQGRGERALIEWIDAPEVRGVLVVAAGAADASVRYRLLQAVETALGIPAHRIQVLPRAR